MNIVLGGGGNDEITGTDDRTELIDVLFGNGGNDVINGGGGFNLLVGGEDNDTLVGGDDGNIALGDTFDFSVTGIPALDAFFNGGRSYSEAASSRPALARTRSSPAAAPT